MGFVDDVSEDAEAILAEQGEQISYTPYGQIARTITAVVDEEEGAAEASDDGRVARDRVVVQVLPSDAPSPDTRDVFTIDSQAYGVESVRHKRFVVEFHAFAITQHRFGGADAYRS